MILSQKDPFHHQVAPWYLETQDETPNTVHLSLLVPLLFKDKQLKLPSGLVQKVDLSKLETNALWRYWHHFNLVSSSV